MPHYARQLSDAAAALCHSLKALLDAAREAPVQLEQGSKCEPADRSSETPTAALRPSLEEPSSKRHCHQATPAGRQHEASQQCEQQPVVLDQQAHLQRHKLPQQQQVQVREQGPLQDKLLGNSEPLLVASNVSTDNVQNVWQSLVLVAVDDIHALQQELTQHRMQESNALQHDPNPEAEVNQRDMAGEVGKALPSHEAHTKLGTKEDFQQLAALSDFDLLSGGIQGKQCHAYACRLDSVQMWGRLAQACPVQLL